VIAAKHLAALAQLEEELGAVEAKIGSIARRRVELGFQLRQLESASWQTCVEWSDYHSGVENKRAQLGTQLSQLESERRRLQRHHALLMQESHSADSRDSAYRDPAAGVVG
jgi:chromosome segregation ATPase